MKVHCPKCNSVNFLPSTLPSSIISNISCAVCKELIDVPNQPELELPDEDLMDVSSLRDTLDEKGRFLNPQAKMKQETADTISLASYDLPPLPADEADPLQFDDLPMPASNETYPMIPDETVSLAPLELNETVDLSYDDLHWNPDNAPKPQEAIDFSETHQNQSFQETPQPYQPQSFQEPPHTTDYQQTFQTQDYQQPQQEEDFQHVYPPPSPTTAQDFQETPYSQQQQSSDDDIWAHLRRETQQAQTQTVSHPPEQMPQQDVGALLLTNEPGSSSNTGIKVLIFGVLALLFLGVGAGAVWLYVNQISNEVSTTTQPAPAKTNPNAASTNTGSKPATTNGNTSSTSNTSSSNNANTNTNTKSQTTNTETKNTSTTNTSSPQNNNTKDASTETRSPSTRERVVKTDGSVGNNSNGNITIQVGSYPNAEGANSRVAQLQAMGFPARVVVANIPRRGTWYRVHVGKFASKEEAERYVRELKSKGATKDALVTDVQ